MLVRIENLTQKTAIMLRGKVANIPWGRLQGLIGTKQLNHGDGLLISPSKGVHSMFMSKPVDVLYVNDAHQIIGIDERLHPNSFGKPKIDCSYVIEVPVGTIALSQTTIGDLLQVIYQGSSAPALHHSLQ